MPVISGKGIGRRKPLFEDFSIPAPPSASGDGGLTLRDLVEFVVREEVKAFQQRQVDRRFIRALTAREIDAAAEKGKVDSGGSDVEPQAVDAEAAVGTALQAFEDGLYLIAIDDRQEPNLDAQVFIRPDSRITFIRLTLLAGG
ncbi:MAG: hypothetical protein HY290_05095 [Planctomycetia bacterium]|nr:hypothetical protein [Planctomycetia bacterium]